MAFDLTDAELEASDRYEEDARYVRIEVKLASGTVAWIYLCREETP